MKIASLVVAPNKRLYEYWRQKYEKNPHEYPYIHSSAELRGYTGPILALNGGPIDNADLLHMIRHPSRAGSVTYLEV